MNKKVCFGYFLVSLPFSMSMWAAFYLLGWVYGIITLGVGLLSLLCIGVGIQLILREGCL